MHGNLLKKNQWLMKQPRYFKLYSDGIIRYYRKEVEFKVSLFYSRVKLISTSAKLRKSAKKNFILKRKVVPTF